MDSPPSIDLRSDTVTRPTPAMLAAMMAEPAYRHIPVIMISSLGEDVLAKKCTGYVAYLRKPFRATAILSTIDRVLGGRANAGIL